MKNKFESKDQTSENKVLDLNNSTRAKNAKYQLANIISFYHTISLKIRLSSAEKIFLLLLMYNDELCDKIPW